jgi:methylated-DNA-[protein]-cysteine S-methyltransferase
MHKLQMKIKTNIGPLYLIASEKYLLGLCWAEQEIPMAKKTAAAELKILTKAEIQLNEYFAGKRKKFNLPLNVNGTPFQKRVWEELSKIPYGEVRSYKDVAVAIKTPRAYRAVGTANGCNQIGIIIPCHRVIAADGTLGGFGGGLAIKEALLTLEKHRSKCEPCLSLL